MPRRTLNCAACGKPGCPSFGYRGKPQNFKCQVCRSEDKRQTRNVEKLVRHKQFIAEKAIAEKATAERPRRYLTPAPLLPVPEEFSEQSAKDREERSAKVMVHYRFALYAKKHANAPSLEQKRDELASKLEQLIREYQIDLSDSGDLMDQIRGGDVDEAVTAVYAFMAATEDELENQALDHLVYSKAHNEFSDACDAVSGFLKLEFAEPMIDELEAWDHMACRELADACRAVVENAGQDIAEVLAEGERLTAENDDARRAREEYYSGCGPILCDFVPARGGMSHPPIEAAWKEHAPGLYNAPDNYATRRQRFGLLYIRNPEFRKQMQKRAIELSSRAKVRSGVLFRYHQPGQIWSAGRDGYFWRLYLEAEGLLSAVTYTQHTELLVEAVRTLDRQPLDV